MALNHGLQRHHNTVDEDHFPDTRARSNPSGRKGSTSNPAVLRMLARAWTALRVSGATGCYRHTLNSQFEVPGRHLVRRAHQQWHGARSLSGSYFTQQTQDSAQRASFSCTAMYLWRQFTWDKILCDFCAFLDSAKNFLVFVLIDAGKRTSPQTEGIKLLTFKLRRGRRRNKIFMH
jgi:hypothetical protein